MLSYPHPQDRGFYLGIWSAMRSSGSVIGGAINFSTNYDRSSTGGVSWGTYLIFIGIECTGIIWALILSSTSKVRRRDGSHIEMSEKITWKQEFVELGKYLRKTSVSLSTTIFQSLNQHSNISLDLAYLYTCLLFLLLWWHYGNISVSAFLRACSSTVVFPSPYVLPRNTTQGLLKLMFPATCTIPAVILYGKLLDTHFIKSQRKRAWIAMAAWCLPQAICFIFVALQYHRLGNKSALDYEM